MDASEQYTQGVKRVKDEYEPKILEVMTEIGDALAEAGFEVEAPYDEHFDDFRWAMLVTVDKDCHPDDRPSEQDIDITFIIAESDQYDGTEDGINFMLNVVKVGGEVIGGMCPFNYSEDVWVPLDNPEAIAERFSYFEQADPDSMVNLIQEV